MLRTPRILTLLSLSLPLCLLAPAALAQTPPKPSEAPPKMQVEDDGAPITNAPQKQGGTRIVEKKEGGRVTEVKVKAGPSTYTMKPHVPAGNAQPGDGQSSAIRAPQWTVLEFDIGGKKKNTEQEAVPEATPAPAPPPPVTVK